MRLVAGEFRGRPLSAVLGSGTRPTTDRVREAWASSLTSLMPEGFVGARVLDAFAGSGALGLEALSRGGASCVFVERDRRAQATLRANIASLGLDEQRARVVGRDVLSPSVLSFLEVHKPFQLLILDPPYDTEQRRIQGLIVNLARVGALRAGSFVSYEQRSGLDDALNGLVLGCACSPMSLEMLSCKTYGTSSIRYYLCH